METVVQADFVPSCPGHEWPCWLLTFQTVDVWLRTEQAGYPCAGHVYYVCTYLHTETLVYSSMFEIWDCPDVDLYPGWSSQRKLCSKRNWMTPDRAIINHVEWTCLKKWSQTVVLDMFTMSRLWLRDLGIVFMTTAAAFWQKSTVYKWEYLLKQVWDLVINSF